MRAVLPAVFFFCACSGARLNSDGQTIRPSDPTPATVEAAAPQAVTVYVEATCKHLETATAHGGGVWINPRTVMTAGHAMFARRHMFPDFALVSPDGSCIDGQYGDWHDSVDLLFILSKRTHPGHLELAKRLPAAGEPAYQVSYEAREEATGRMLFSRRRVTIEPLPDSRVYFGAKPVPRQGDSGSPLIGEDGKIIGMVVALGSYPEAPEKGEVGVYLSALSITYFLGQCGPCEEE